VFSAFTAWIVPVGFRSGMAPPGHRLGVHYGTIEDIGRQSLEDARNPAFDPRLVGHIRSPETPFQVSFISQDSSMKPTNVEREERSREPRGKCDRQTEHENQMTEIHRVAQIAVGAGREDVFGRYVNARPTSSVPYAIGARQTVLQVPPYEENRAPGVNDKNAPARSQFERNDADGINQECAFWRAS